jgi:hypothetical protein
MSRVRMPRKMRSMRTRTAVLAWLEPALLLAPAPPGRRVSPRRPGARAPAIGETGAGYWVVTRRADAPPRGGPRRSHVPHVA